MVNGKTWTRRIQWLEGDGLIKLKLQDGDTYKEVLVSQVDADKVWQRFEDGQTIDDCCSILTQPVPQSMQSRKAARSK